MHWSGMCIHLPYCLLKAPSKVEINLCVIKVGCGKFSVAFSILFDKREISCGVNSVFTASSTAIIVAALVFCKFSSNGVFIFWAYLHKHALKSP